MKNIKQITAGLILATVAFLYFSRTTHFGNTAMAQTKISLEGKSFSTMVSGLCAETMPPDPCVSYTDYMELHFKKDIVEIVDERIQCDKPRRKTSISKWNWVAGNRIKIEKLNYEGQPFITDNQLVLKNNMLVGKHNTRFTQDFTFEPMVKKMPGKK